MARPSKWTLIRPFFLILILRSLAIYLFTRGFLLTRTELSSYSHCSDLSQSNPDPCSSSSQPEPDYQCWTRPAVDRLVIIVLNALRFDFVAPSTFFGGTKRWMDKLRVLQKLASEENATLEFLRPLQIRPQLACRGSRFIKYWASFNVGERESADDDEADMRIVTHDHSPL